MNVFLLQLMVASVLTTVYALLQMLVMVGIIIQIAEEGPCSPTALFFFYVTATFILAAVLHPQVCARAPGPRPLVQCSQTTPNRN